MTSITEPFLRELRPRRVMVDFSQVPENQREMHARLENWARACRGGGSGTTAPMFRQFQSPDHWEYGRETEEPLDRHDAMLVGKGVAFLPEYHRVAIQWYYVKRSSVMQARRALACTAEALSRYVVDGRQMLVNRGI